MIDFKKASKAEKAALIAFAVDNNPREVGFQMQQRGYDLTGVSIDQYKKILVYADSTGHDVSWILDVPYIDSAQNWTTNLVQQYKPADSMQAKGISWSDVGNIALNVGLGVLTGVLGANANNASGDPKTVYVADPKPQIFGMDPALFWALMLILVIIIFIGIYALVKK